MAEDRQELFVIAKDLPRMVDNPGRFLAFVPQVAGPVVNRAGDRDRQRYLTPAVSAAGSAG